MFRIIFILVLGIATTSCSLGGGKAPQDHFYRLPEVKLEAQSTKFKSFVIKPVKSSGLYHERAILFVESERPLELQRYHYSFWSTTPAELIHNALYQGLYTSGIATQVSRALSENRPDYIIDSRIIHFERFIKNQQVDIEVELEVSVRSGNLSGVEWTKRYKAGEKVLTTDMHASVEAFGVALNNISKQIVNDLMALP
jgi:ABC-type uncharacterized transport system auxiliary subunit